MRWLVFSTKEVRRGAGQWNCPPNMTITKIVNIGTTQVKIYPMAVTCQEVGHCLVFSTDCNLYPFDPGLCRERLEIIRYDPSSQPEVYQGDDNHEEYRDVQSA